MIASYSVSVLRVPRTLPAVEENALEGVKRMVVSAVSPRRPCATETLVVGLEAENGE